MGNSEASNRATREEWRDLGFYYDRDEARKCWRLMGSVSGLRRFASALRSYCDNPSNATQSEHVHFGPYMYLKVMTWTDAGISGGSVHGSLDDLIRLASLIDTSLSQSTAGDTIYLGCEYVTQSEYDLLLFVKDDDCDPAMLDAGIN